MDQELKKMDSEGKERDKSPTGHGCVSREGSGKNSGEHTLFWREYG